MDRHAVERLERGGGLDDCPTVPRQCSNGVPGEDEHAEVGQRRERRERGDADYEVVAEVEEAQGLQPRDAAAESVVVDLVAAKVEVGEEGERIEAIESLRGCERMQIMSRRRR